ncbi:MAG TPA: 2-oxo-4-hydroxy-4-carboxy-5-ureidoimidazoline decarboxylase [Pyrinomonadaceae bacterium]
MKQRLSEFNALPREAAQSELMKCCGSTRWAQMVADARPFSDLGEMLLTADRVWQSLDATDWLEAFSHHPQIGERKAERAQAAEASRWSAQEQSGTRDADAPMASALAAANRAYLQKFGHIFIVCATGKSAGEMLSACEQRLQHDPATELRIAAEEQRRITHLRLRKLLESEEQGV